MPWSIQQQTSVSKSGEILYMRYIHDKLEKIKCLFYKITIIIISSSSSSSRRSSRRHTSSRSRRKNSKRSSKSSRRNSSSRKSNRCSSWISSTKRSSNRRRNRRSRKSSSKSSRRNHSRRISSSRMVNKSKRYLSPLLFAAGTQADWMSPVPARLPILLWQPDQLLRWIYPTHLLKYYISVRSVWWQCYKWLGYLKIWYLKCWYLKGLTDWASKKDSEKNERERERGGGRGRGRGREGGRTTIQFF